MEKKLTKKGLTNEVKLVIVIGILLSILVGVILGVYLAK